MRAALEKLDVRRAQIFVEALIVELTASKAAEFGVQWQSLKGLGGNSATGFGGTNFGTTGQNIIGIAANPATVGPGLNVGVVDGTVAIPGIGTISNLSVLARALETDANANILSTPTLLTLDNEEAKIIIGQNVPFVTGSYAVSGAATTPTPFTTVERHDVGLTLQIKPQISEGGTVRLQIYQEVSTIDDKSNLTGIIINKRAVQSTILVDDKQIVVIGGLIDDQGHRRRAKGSPAWRYPGSGRAVPLQDTLVFQDQSDDFPAADPGAQQPRIPAPTAANAMTTSAVSRSRQVRSWTRPCSTSESPILAPRTNTSPSTPPKNP